MTITQLEYVVAVATHGSFVGAAEKCFVTQPTLSMQIHKLEDELEVKLFDRTRQPIEITPIGKVIVEQAKKTLAASNKIKELIAQEKKSISGTFRLAIIPTLAPYLVPGFLKLFASENPKITLIVTERETSDIISGLKNNEIDAGLLSTPLEDDEIEEYPLFHEAFTVYLSQNDQLLGKKSLSPDDVDLHKLWLLNEGHCMRNQVLNLCSENIQEIQKEKNYRYESSNVETLLQMVDTLGGIAIVPELATRDFNEEQQERLRYFNDPEPVREVSFVTNKHFVRTSILEQLKPFVLNLVPEKMRIINDHRKIIRIKSAKL